MEPTQPQSSPVVPIAIIVGFGLIAVAIYLTNGNSQAPTQMAQTAEMEGEMQPGVPRPVDESDYILGNPNAPIVMIEYSDYDCPFCKEYHNTMHQIMDEYGVTGKLAWVYRQYPLAELHPNSPRISEAALCVGDIGGNSAFWDFSDKVFRERNIDEPTNVTKLLGYAEDAGVAPEDYIECMESGRMQPAVEASLRDGFNAGARGTPYTVLIVGNQQAVINGAQPYETVKGIVENLVGQLHGTFDAQTATTSSDVPVNEVGVPVLN
jgi:protein-disulfide isomerase